MSTFVHVTPDKKPWLNHEDPYLKTFYPLSWGKENSYALFSPGIDRFFLVDTYDPWIMLETSRVLSSKISNIVYVLDHPSPEFDNENCLLYTTKHKQNEYSNFGGPKIMHHRQSSFMLKAGPDKIVKRSWPIDFNKPERKEALLKITEYSAFCLRAMHALYISLNFKNPFPEKYYLETYFKDQYPEDLLVYADATECVDGMEKEIKSILYWANDSEEAMSKIDNAWRTYSQQDLSGYRQLFYYTMGLKQPPDLHALGHANTADKDRNEQTIWIV